MEITEKEAFKLGFLARCAEEQLRGEALDARLGRVEQLVKSAESEAKLFKYVPLNWGPASLGKAISGANAAITGFGKMLYTVPFGLSILGGGGLGYGAAKMMEPTIDDDQIKAQELAATYKLYADKARTRRKLRKYRTDTRDEY